MIAPYEPQIPIAELVEQFNRFYHASAARHYDKRHPETRDGLLATWREMLTVGLASFERRPLRVLDFGCGTGFEAIRLLENGGDSRIEELVCYDLSPEMLSICRDRLARFSCPIRIVSDREALSASGGRFDVLLTNSLLHHLPDPLDTIQRLGSVMSDCAVWLAGHEPSSRFLRNPECRDVLTRFQNQWRYRKYLSLRAYVSYAKEILLQGASPAKKAALEAEQRGLVRRKPPARVVARLVDCHVPNSREEVEMGRGFDVSEMADRLAGQWQLAWSRTYNFMGYLSENMLPAAWLRRCRELERRFPHDGSTFCAVWRRVQRRDGT
ncbi:MAG: class I SAM-dependent methyltransferase [Pirellulales bacterium]|nr:class I SAM-dependent methyltransferase [Pirellulales bacterium]